MLQKEIGRGTLGGAFLLSDLFPGERLAGERAADWKAFWNPDRVRDLRQELTKASREMGFSPGIIEHCRDGEVIGKGKIPNV